MSGGPVKREKPKEAAPAAPPKVTRSLTAEEVSTLYSTAEALTKAAAEAKSGPASKGLTLPSISADSIGMHITKDRTNILLLSRKGYVEKQFSINSGYGELDALTKELGHELPRLGKKKYPTHISMTGAVSPSIIAELPKLNRP